MDFSVLSSFRRERSFVSTSSSCDPRKANGGHSVWLTSANNTLYPRPGCARTIRYTECRWSSESGICASSGPASSSKSSGSSKSSSMISSSDISCRRAQWAHASMAVQTYLGAPRGHLCKIIVVLFLGKVVGICIFVVLQEVLVREQLSHPVQRASLLPPDGADERSAGAYCAPLPRRLGSRRDSGVGESAMSSEKLRVF